ncbi:MAG: hypothetical protein NT069_17985, partial [Planctomycetota bacterium]|nr:hypothetical protein [Planctomycetota bacterium]
MRNFSMTRHLRLLFGLCALSLSPLSVDAVEPVRLTRDGTLKFSPVFVDEGRAVVFATHENPNLVALRRWKLADGSSERLHP